MKLRVLLGLMLCYCVNVLAQTETTSFTEFKNNASTNILPDFSYAGYHHGEIRIPRVSFPIFDVTTYGAIADDTVSDKTAIQNAINAAALTNQPAIVFFPKGKFIIANATDNKFVPLKINSSNIVLRGSGSGPGGTELFMKTFNVPQVAGSNPPAPDTLNNKWKINPGIFIGYDDGVNTESFITSTTAASAKGSFTITVANATSSLLQPGKWVLLSYFNNDINAINAELAPNTKQASMTNLTALKVDAYHQIVAVSGNQITFKEPLIYDISASKSWSVKKANYIQEICIEDILFSGNWKRPFVHHRTWQDDSGWVIFDLNRITNSWISNCVFKDVNRIGFTRNSGCVSFVNNKLIGNAGHEAFSSGGSWTFIGNNTDETYKSGNLSGQQHSYGLVERSVGAVLWRNTFPAATGFECHAGQPRNSLLDLNTGGLYYNKAGGAAENLPHHMQNLVLWNYNRTNSNSNVAPISNFSFWNPDTNVNFKAAPVTVIGLHGVSTTFVSTTVKRVESNGTKVFPESLYEAQLKLRLGYQQGWLNELYQSSAYDDVLVYDKSNFNGMVVNLSEGNYLQADLAALGLLNDSISSVKIPLGYSIELYVGDNLSGTSFVYTGEANVSVLDVSILKQVSSLKISRVAIGYDDLNGLGTVKMSFLAGNYSSFPSGFDNKFSSFYIPSGYRLTIFSNANFSGNSQIIDGNNSYFNLNSQLSNWASSLRLEPITAPQVLPATLNKFEVKNLGDMNALSWSTLAEPNHSHFDVLRYDDFKRETFLKRIERDNRPEGNKEYFYLDKQPLKGYNYYFLKQVDFDGKFKLYGPKSTENTLQKIDRLSIYVNSDNLIIKINASSHLNKQATLALFDIGGKRLYEESLQMREVLNQVVIKKPVAGLYFVMVNGQGFKDYQKVLIN
ncbi:development-specific protein S [Pedobacter glucosidilyticus]|nr:DUF4955 domain-containing protein [Pedobacter glucosidilyticus]KHJ38717.1 development-specific protein S [Pedobacter glucosidilyticus]